MRMRIPTLITEIEISKTWECYLPKRINNFKNLEEKICTLKARMLRENLPRSKSTTRLHPYVVCFPYLQAKIITAIRSWSQNAIELLEKTKNNSMHEEMIDIPTANQFVSTSIEGEGPNSRCMTTE